MEDTHGSELRGLQSVPLSPSFEGRFGRLFRTLPPLSLPDEALFEIADAMPEAGPGQQFENPDLPAGYTYVGQLLDHDITFDPASSLQRLNDPGALVDFRTPRLDLDCLYGRGPGADPFLYDQTADSGQTKLLVGAVPGTQPPEPDLPRNHQGRALIGDPRNDENTIVGQLQLTMIKFHNQVVEDMRGTSALTGNDLFVAAQREVRWHYQWAVVHDFLPRVIGQDLHHSLLEQTPMGEVAHLRFYRARTNAFMPVEFSVAAYRFGHSMIRPSYDLNNVVTARPIFVPDVAPDQLADLRGFRPLPAQWSISWPHFFELDAAGPQHAHLIDTRLSPPLFTLPGEDPADQDRRSLARRNLLRGSRLQLPSGQDVAQAMGVVPLTDQDLSLPGAGPAPLWYYVLKEAEVSASGRHLGPVGGRIVGETLLGLLKDDPQSYLKLQPTWVPTRGPQPGQFSWPNLLTVAAPDRVARA